MTIRVLFDRGVAYDSRTRALVAVVLKRDGKGTALTLKHDQFFDEAARARTAAAGTKRSTSLKLTQGA